MDINTNNSDMQLNSTSNEVDISSEVPNINIMTKNNFNVESKANTLNIEVSKVVNTGGKINDVLVNGESVADEKGNANIDTSEFIKNTVDNLVNYYLKSETYSKEEIDELANAIANAGYATEKWVKDQDYMPIEDFLEYINYFYYNKTKTDELLSNKVDKEDGKGLSTNDYDNTEKQNVADNTANRHSHENKGVLDNITQENLDKWNNNKGIEYKADDNVIIEDQTIKTYTNTGYKVSDKDIMLQSIIDTGTTGTNKIIYAKDKEIMFIIDGTNKLRKSENGIDFEIITMPRACKDMIYMNGHDRLIALSNDGYFFYSDDYGKTWTEKQSSMATGGNYLFRQYEYTKGFGVVNITNKTVTTLNESLFQNSSIKSTIAPNFWAKVNNTQFIYCNSTGTFKYGAGSQEGNFASLSGVTINLLKRVNDITMIGLKNDNKMYILEPATSITAYTWVEYTLPDVCTVNDIIFNPYDETYYIFTDINTYYKTKDFVEYENVDKDSLRGIQGCFTLMGIQTTTSNHNELLLAPTRTTLENKAQEWDRALNKSLWVGNGLELSEEDKVKVKVNGTYLIVNSNGLTLGEIDEWKLNQDIIESIYVAKAELKENFDPYEIENWYWSEDGVPIDNYYKATKFVFNQAGSFYNQATWEEEIFVEQYDYGYLFFDQNMSIFKYVKLGNLSWLFN